MGNVFYLERHRKPSLTGLEGFEDYMDKMLANRSLRYERGDFVLMSMVLENTMPELTIMTKLYEARDKREATT